MNTNYFKVVRYPNVFECFFFADRDKASLRQAYTEARLHASSYGGVLSVYRYTTAVKENVGPVRAVGRPVRSTAA